MPAADLCEPPIIRALEKAGWEILRKQHPIRLGRLQGKRRELVYADLLLQRLWDGQLRQIIVVEIKCFPANRAWLDELYHAIGQYIIYRASLERQEIGQPLYLAVPNFVYDTFLTQPTIQAATKDAKIKLIVVDLEQEDIVSWLD